MMDFFFFTLNTIPTHEEQDEQDVMWKKNTKNNSSREDNDY